MLDELDFLYKSDQARKLLFYYQVKYIWKRNNGRCFYNASLKQPIDEVKLDRMPARQYYWFGFILIKKTLTATTYFITCQQIYIGIFFKLKDIKIEEDLQFFFKESCLISNFQPELTADLGGEMNKMKKRSGKSHVALEGKYKDRKSCVYNLDSKDSFLDHFHYFSSKVSFHH